MTFAQRRISQNVSPSLSDARLQSRIHFLPLILVIRCSVILSYRFRSPCGICGGQCGTWTGLSQSTLLFPCHYHSASAPHWYFTRVSPMVDHHATGSVIC